MNTISARRVMGVLFAAAGLAMAVTGCDTGSEGQRCNPSLSHDECNAGLSCQQPKDCPENYCCPTSGTTTNPYCQPGCAGGQASICAAGGDADCPSEGGAASDGVGEASEAPDARDATSDGGEG